MATRDQMRATQERLEEVVAAYRALKAENEGYRERVKKNAERRFAQRHERLLLKFIDILDNLDRALEAAELSYAGGPLIEGLILVRTQLLQTLQEEGLERIPVVGLPYDPEGAEAMETQPVDDPEQHHIVLKDLQRGYRLNGQVARAAQVVVGQYSGELPVPSTEPEPAESAPSPAREPAAADDGPGERVEIVAGDETTDGLVAAAAAMAPLPGDSGRMEVIDDTAEAGETEAILAAAAEAAAAALASPEPDTEALDPEPLEAARREGEDRYGVDGDEDSLESAARAAAALVDGSERDEDASQAVPQVGESPDDVEEVGVGLEPADEPLEAIDEPETDSDESQTIVDFEPESDLLEEVPEDELGPDGPETAEVGGDGSEESPDAPSHPLDDVDPSVFENGASDEEER